MKKIININLSGRVIPIEDSAYESLQRYIDSLRRYFAAEEGRDEIINDIESRVAELMNDKIKKGAAAVTESDISEIINTMGRVEDFVEADAAEGPTAFDAGESTASPFANIKNARGRFYRDSSDKMIGGVCSGIANYLSIDPAIVRVLFVVLTFGAGMSFLVYLILWIFVPGRPLQPKPGKRFFRNPDDRILGGVAGGIAAYLNKEAWVIRLIFAAPLLLNILFGLLNGFFFAFHRDIFPNFVLGSFTGTFVITYIILWIILPEARTTYEKMEMRGETVDVNTIRQNVQEGMSDIKSKAQAWGSDVKDTAQNFSNRAKEFADTNGRRFATEVAQTARPVANGCIHAIGVLFKAFFLFVAGLIAFVLFIIVVVFTIGGVARPFNDFLLNGFWQNASLWGTLIFFLAVPLIAIITWVVRRIMKVRTQNRYLGWSFGGMWALGWVCLFFFIASMSRDWRYYNNISEEVPLTQTAMEKMVVRVNEPVIRYGGNFDWLHSDQNGWDLTDDSLKISNVKLRIDKSEDSNYHVSVLRYSAGRTRADAGQRAEKIVYHVSSLDSNLILGSGFGVGKAEKFRGQKIIVEIKIPAGKKIRFNESVEEKLNPVNVRVKQAYKRGRNWNRDWDIDWDEDSYYDWKSNVDYIMTAEGTLVSTEEANKPAATDTYEYKKDSTNNLNGVPDDREQRRLDEQIEKQQRLIEKENKRLEDLQRKKENDGTTQVPAKKAHKYSENTAQILSPIFSLI